MITHDLGVVAGMCQTINVLYGCKVVKTAPRRVLFGQPRHPYTVGLLGSIPRLDAPRGEKLTPITGSVRDVLPWAEGCAFAPRCFNRIERCVEGTPDLYWTAAQHGYRCVNPVTDQEVEAK